MLRWSDERFLTEKPNMDSIYAIRIKDGEFYFIAWMEDAENYNIKAAHNIENCRLNRDVLMLSGNVGDGILDSDGINRCDILWETDTDGNPVSAEDKAYPSAYHRFLSLVQCYERKGKSDDNDHDILEFSNQELASLCDCLRDGDYILIDSEMDV